MKLADDALIRIIEILRQGLMENKDISDLLRELELTQDGTGKLSVASASTDPDWTATE